MRPKQTGHEGINRIELAQVREQWEALVNTVMRFQVLRIRRILCQLRDCWCLKSEPRSVGLVAGKSIDSFSETNTRPDQQKALGND
jgi:hypothetical protein